MTKVRVEGHLYYNFGLGGGFGLKVIFACIYG
jgi:hypothetical protein